MRTCTFQSVLYGTAKMLGLDTTRDLSPARAAMLCEYVNNRVKEGWEYDWWPELTVRQLRYYRPLWNPATTYNPIQGGVFTPQEVGYQTASGIQYYQAVQPSTGVPPTMDEAGDVNLQFWAALHESYNGLNWEGGINQAPGDIVWDPVTQAWWQCWNAHLTGLTMNYGYYGQLDPLDRYVAYNQPGLTPIGRVRGVYLRDRFVATRNPGAIPFEKSNLGVQVGIRAPNQVYVEFALLESVFTTTAWSATMAYTGAGELVYRGTTTGQCYSSTAAGTNLVPESNPNAWALVPFPLVLANFVKRAALSDALADLKQMDRQQIEENRAYEELSNAVDREIYSQAGSERAMAETYGSGL